MSIHVRSHERQTASGKTTTVRAHEREGGGEVISEAPSWVQPARPDDFGPVPLAPTTWQDEDAESAGDWWSDGGGEEEERPGMFRRLAQEIREVRAEDKQMREDLRSGRKEYGTDWRTGSRDPDLDPDQDSPALTRKDEAREWRARDVPLLPPEPMSPQMEKLMGCGTPEGREKYERLRAYREAGYTGPLDQDNRIPDPDDPASSWAF